MKRLSILLSVLIFSFSAYSQQMNVNTSESELKWTGKKISGEHWGYVQIKEGTLEVENNKIKSGEFKIDMNTINCKDLEDPEWNGKLVGHLKSDDFFSVDKYPVATLTITESTPFKNGESKVKGKLTIKDITNPISFTALKTKDGYSATITVDRTKYNVRYGSGKFFENLGDNMIYDDFTLEVKLVLN